MHFADIPCEVDVIKENGSKARVSFSHSLPEDSRFHGDIAYEVVELGRSREERALKGHSMKNRSGRKSMIVDGYCGRSLKVRAYFKDNPKLGDVYSDRYKGEH